MSFQPENSYPKLFVPPQSLHIQGFVETTTSNVDGMFDVALLSDIAPRLMLPTKSIDQWSTLIHIDAISMPSTTWSSFGIESLPVDEQGTAIVPAVHRTETIIKTQSSEERVGKYTTQLSILVKSSGIYAFASLASPLVSLVLMPFLTHSLSRNEYGALAVLTTVVALLVGVSQFGLGNAFFRAYSCDYEDRQDRLAIVSTVFVLLAGISIPITMLILFTAPWLSDVLFSTSVYMNAVRLAALIILAQNLTVPGLSWLRAENRAVLYSILSVANMLVNLAGAIFYVGFLHMGLNGALLATGGGYAIIVVCTLPVLLVRAGLRVRRDISQNLLSFGLPLVSNFVSVWILQLSDRYLLSHFTSLAQTASYAVAYSLGGLLGVVVLSPFSLAWPTAMFTIAKRDDAPRVYQIIFRWYSLLLLFSTFALSLASTVVFDFFFPATYHAAAPVIPIVALSIMFYAVYNFFNTGISITRKTWYAVLFTTVAAIVNVGFNLVLIPHFGSLGAAWSTLLAYTLLTVVAYVVNQRIYTIPFEVDIFMIGLVAGITLYVAGSLLAQGHSVYETFGVPAGALAVFCLILAGLALFAHSRNKNKAKKAEDLAVL